MELIPIDPVSGRSTHATVHPDPVKEAVQGRKVKALCGKSMLVQASFPVGTFDQHVSNIPRGYEWATCERCTHLAGMDHLKRYIFEED